MTDQTTTTTPVDAAQVARSGERALTRYSTAAEVLTRITGRLEEVSTIGENDAWINVREILGMQRDHMATAVIPNPPKQIDELLEKIGCNGDITLIGIARRNDGGIAQTAHDRGPQHQRDRRPRRPGPTLRPAAWPDR